MRLISLPALPPAWSAHGITYAQQEDHAVDVVIRFGPTPVGLRGPARSSRRVQIRDGEWLLHLAPDVRILASRGREITVDAPDTWPPAEIAAWVQGPATVAVLYQRGLIPLHASAVSVDGRIVAFFGPSGAGKSSLAAACVAAGARFVTDDVFVASLGGDGGMVGYPGPVSLRLDPAAASRLSGRRLFQMVADHDGKLLATPEDGGITRPEPIGAVVVLRVGGQLGCEPISDLELHADPHTLLHRPRLSTALGAGVATAELLSALTRRVQAWQLVRPASAWTLAECLDRIGPVLGGGGAWGN